MDFTATTKFTSVFFYLHCFKDFWAWHLLQELGKCLQLQKLTEKKKIQHTTTVWTLGVSKHELFFLISGEPISVAPLGNLDANANLM